MDDKDDEQLRDEERKAKAKMLQARAEFRQIQGERRERDAVTNPLLRIGRQRYRRFAGLVIQNLASGQSLQDAAAAAVRDVFFSLKTTATISKKARELLARPEIKTAIEEVFKSCEMTSDEAIDWHTKHTFGAKSK